MQDILRLMIEDHSQVGEARRRALPLCRALGFSEVDSGKVSLLVTEAATNLVKHAGGGELLIRTLECGGVTGLELLALDKGPGMANPSRSRQDGVSTAGSPGTGLGALVRTSSLFDLYSGPGKGTVVLCRYWAGRLPEPLAEHPLAVGAVCLPMHDDDPCGDGWAMEQRGPKSSILVCDGLGHGFDAAAASREAERLFRSHQGNPPQPMVEILHGGLRSTRGAALAVLELDHAAGTLRYCGIGNIAARVVTEEREKNLVSHNGTAGHEMRKLQEFAYPWDDSGVLVMHSDGMATGWRLSDYPGLVTRHPSVIAAVLYRDYRRGRDDVTVLVGRKMGMKP